MNLKKTNEFRWNIYICLVALLSVLPNTSIFNYARVIIILFEISKKILLRNKIKLKKIHLIIFFTWILNILLGVFFVLISGSGDIDKVILYHETTRLFMYLILWLSLSDQRYDYTQLIIMSKGLLIFHLSIQILQYFKVEVINNLIMMIYTQGELTKHLSLAIETGAHFRSGSIYTNPNVYMVFPLLFFAILMQQYLFDHKKINLIWITLAIASLILTGSRTTIISVALMLTLFVKMERKTIYRSITAIVIFIVIILLIANNELISDFRVFDLFSGFSNSIAVKTSGLSDYFSNMKISNLFFGGLSDLNLSKRIDMELGYVMSWFGINGYIWYFLIYLSLSKNLKKFVYLKYSVLIVFLTVSLTASVLFNFQAFNFISLLMYPHIFEGKGDNHEI